jgi:peptidoglycan/LPS O-acetylase OafA/YrhL
MFPQLQLGITTATLGGALLIFAFISWQPAIALGKNPLIHWLGVRSFSLYLIHEPIVVSIAFCLHATNPFLVGLFAVPLSLAATEVFFRLVERPSHRLAGLVGRAVANRVSRREEVSIA